MNIRSKPSPAHPTGHRLDRAVVESLDVFQGLSDANLDDVLEHARIRRFEPKTFVFQQGMDADMFFVLLDGRLKVVQTTADGQEVLVRFVVPGELFGIAAAIGRRDYPGNAIAVVESLVLCWPTPYWGQLVARCPTVATNSLRTVGERLAEQHARVREMSTQSIERRIAHVLLRLARQSGRPAEDGVEIGFPITRQDLGDMTAATLFTVSRIMSAWEQKGIIGGGRRHIVIRDPHALVVIAEGGENK